MKDLAFHPGGFECFPLSNGEPLKDFKKRNVNNFVFLKGQSHCIVLLRIDPALDRYVSFDFRLTA